MCESRARTPGGALDGDDALNAPTASGWRRLDATRAADLEVATRLSRRATAEVDSGARGLDLDWRRGPDGALGSLRVYALGDAGGPCGLAVFSVARKPLRFSIGEVGVYRASLTRLWHVGEPYLSAELDGERARAACQDLLVACLRDLGTSECLFLEGLPVDGPMRAALAAGAGGGSRALCLELGQPFAHQLIRMPPSFAEYLQQLGSRSRQSVLYSQRRLRKDMEGQVRCECFETCESIDRFVRDAQAVSRKTYQWNLLGLGLRDTPALRAGLTATAKAGWLRSFILYCRDTPVAFMLGYQHGSCYYYDDVGYDPDYSKSSVGSVLQIEVLEYLYGRSDRPAVFDFSTGYGEHKGRFGNAERQEQNLLVFPATVRNRLLIRAYRACEAVSHAGVAVLDRLGLKARLKQLIRRASARGAAEP